ncbi:MAG: PspC protein [Marmoricola sp.]|nr:PspC protein [Marmoricola sp.]
MVVPVGDDHDGVMNETTYDQRPAHQDLDRLRRSVSDRYVAGVAGGLGRHFGIDPTIIRVLLAVLTLFGGAGVIVYAVCWAFVPEDGHDRAVIHVRGDARKILLLAALAIAFAIAMGDAFNGFNAGWPIASVAVVIGVVLIARDRRDDRRTAAAGPVPTDGAPADAPAPAWAMSGATDTVIDPAGTPYPAAGTTDAPPAPPAWQPPVAQPPLIPPHPKRTGIIWFWPTLALIAIGLGTLGLIDSGSTHVVPAAYPALAIAITGVMLLIGSYVGRPGGLILVGFVSCLALALATVVGGFNLSGRSVDVAPASAIAVQPSYQATNGRIRLDLTQVSDPAGLAGRTLHLTLHAGQIDVIVPRTINVDVNADFGFAGGIEVPGYSGGGVQDSVQRHLIGTSATTVAPLTLDLHANVGQITVEQR